MTENSLHATGPAARALLRVMFGIMGLACRGRDPYIPVFYRSGELAPTDFDPVASTPWNDAPSRVAPTTFTHEPEVGAPQYFALANLPPDAGARVYIEVDQLVTPEGGT